MSYSLGESFTSSPRTETSRCTRSTEIAAAEYRLGALALHPMAQRGADACDEFGHAEGLGDVVVGAEIEGFDLAPLVAAARQAR